MSNEFEIVYTVDDYYDGPRAGVAEFGGSPCYYRSVYLDNEEWNPDEDRFELSPISSEVLTAAVEAEAIFQRWNAVRNATPEREYTDEEFGALPEEQTRSVQLKQFLEESFAIAANESRILVRGEFRPASSAPTQLEVCWRAVP